MKLPLKSKAFKNYNKNKYVRVAITGKPGVGKSTLCLKTYNFLKNKIIIKGFITIECRIGGKRIGFQFFDLASGEKLWLARRGNGEVMVGKYTVFVENIDVMAERIEDYKNADLIIIDEIGPMELKSKKFINSIENIMRFDNLLFTVHYKSKHPLVKKIKDEFNLIVIDRYNREDVFRRVVSFFDI